MNSLEKLVEAKNKKMIFRVALHLFFWLIYWLISYYFNTISINLYAGTQLVWAEPLCDVLNLLLFYYPFVYFIWPILFRKRKYLAGIILLALQVLLYTFLYELQERLLIRYCPSCKAILATLPPSMNSSAEQSLMDGMLTSFLSLGIFYVLVARLSPVLAIKFSLDFIKERTASLELEKENILLEFNFLKAQVNPHFLFNTLNNIQSLIVQNRKSDASATVAKLSDFLRHALYETGKNRISLEKEIKLLQDYIELEQLRLNKTIVQFQVDTQALDISIPPLLLVPIVENAFKYTADNLPGRSFIHLHLATENGVLFFETRNNYDPAKRNKAGGIGLQNLRKRLLNVYSNKHELTIKDENFVYTISLKVLL